MDRTLTSDRLDNFTKLDKLGEGTYGVVYKAKDNTTSDVVALKRIRLESEEEGVPSTTIREIALLKELKHPTIIRLNEVINTPKKLTLVFEYCEMDLKKYIERQHRKLEMSVIRSLMFQLLCGVAFCHSRRILHRDLKPQNLMLTSDLQLKIGDFGLARAFGIPVRSFTHEVVTLWYRPPDVLFGSKKYSTPVDLWSCGCILGEMLVGRPIFPGSNENDELIRIFKILGTPTTQKWAGMTELPLYGKFTFPHYPPRNLSSLFPTLDEQGLDLLSRLLIFDPNQRITAKQAIVHPCGEGKTATQTEASFFHFASISCFLSILSQIIQPESTHVTFQPIQEFLSQQTSTTVKLK
ncbi:putative Cell division control protein 2 like protein [Blattamonas nauphoetae]|uniref:Cell division control protein 2 like protein n=1 Tax=Blattamonas nauphoetae TaxID=2049346 RepID=A0ABQ9Y6N1_9EUKA|nr:putative Cell division control protein 2 like protein [Blattamonas nauphoetae]